MKLLDYETKTVHSIKKRAYSSFSIIVFNVNEAMP